MKENGIIIHGDMMMNILDRLEMKKMILLKEKIEFIKREAKDNGRFSLFHASFATEKIANSVTYKELKYIYNLILGHDKDCNISYNDGVTIDRLVNEKAVLVHRSKLEFSFLDRFRNGIPDSDELYDIMKRGLINNGQRNLGADSSSKIPSFSKTITPLIGLAGYINLLSSYKRNDAVILMAFPKELFDSEGNVVANSFYEDVYDLSSYNPRVKPNFMYGAFVKDGVRLSRLYLRDEIIDTYEKEHAIENNNNNVR